MNRRYRDSSESARNPARSRSASSGRMGRTRMGVPSRASSSMETEGPGAGTTSAPSRGAARLAPAEQAGLLSLELLLGDGAAVLQVRQALELLGDRRRRGRLGRRLGRSRGRTLHLHGVALGPLVDHLLDVLGMPDVGEDLLPAGAGRLDDEVARPD